MAGVAGHAPAMVRDASEDPHMTETPHQARTGRSRRVLDVRGGSREGHGVDGLEHREALIYTLGKAAELEHLIMLQYLFAAFSLKQTGGRGT